MQKQLTINLDERIYDKLNAKMDTANISKFIEMLVRPYLYLNDSDNKATSHAQSNTKENSISLYEHIMSIPKVSYDDDPMEIQKQMRDEWL